MHAYEPSELKRELGWIRAVAKGLVRDEALADDIAQKAAVVALEHGRGGAPSDRGWLRTVVRNFARRHRRDEARHRRLQQQRATGASSETPPELLARTELQHRVVDAVLSLEDPYRSTILLRYFEDWSPKQIATSHGVPVDTVYTRLRRAHAQLASKLDDLHDGDRRQWAGLLVGISERTSLLPKVSRPPAIGAASLVVIVAGILTVLFTITDDEARMVDNGREAGTTTATDSASRTETPLAESGTADFGSPHESDEPDGVATDNPESASEPKLDPTEERLFGIVLDQHGEPAPNATVVLALVDAGVTVDRVEAWLRTIDDPSQLADAPEASRIPSASDAQVSDKGWWLDELSNDQILRLVESVHSDLLGNLESLEVRTEKTRTNANGEFDFGKPPSGKFTLMAFRAGESSNSPTESGSSSEPVELRLGPSDAMASLAVVARRADGVLEVMHAEVRVTAEPTGFADPRYELGFGSTTDPEHDAPKRHWRSLRRYGRSEEAESLDSRYLSKLYRLPRPSFAHVESSINGVRYYFFDVKIEKPHERLVIDLPELKTLRGQLVDSQGAPVPFARLSFHPVDPADRDRDRGGSALTDETGRFVRPGLPNGIEVTVRIQGPGYPVLDVETVLVTPEEKLLALPPLIEIRGSVRAASGDALRRGAAALVTEGDEYASHSWLREIDPRTRRSWLSRHLLQNLASQQLALENLSAYRVRAVYESETMGPLVRGVDAENLGFVLRCPSPGRYRLRIRPGSNRADVVSTYVTEPFDVPESGRSALEFVLPRGGSLNVVGKGLDRAELEPIDPKFEFRDNRLQRVGSDLWTLDGIPEGNYRLSVERDRKVVHKEEVHIVDGEKSVLTLDES